MLKHAFVLTTSIALAATMMGCAISAEDVSSDSESIVVKSKTWLVSDIDDTIKRTDVLDHVGEVVNAVQSRNAFSGMSLLYTGWHNDNTANKKITYLSAAPGPVIFLGEHFLVNSGFPGDTDQVTQSVVGGRKFLESAGNFKTRKLYEMYDADVAARTVPGTVILIGDNGEQDMLAYGNYINYVAAKGGRTDRIYSFIHHAYDTPKGSAIVAPHRAWVTAADLAVQLRELGLINEATLSGVMQQVWGDLAEQPDTVIPPFMGCAQWHTWPALSAGDVNASEYRSIQGMADDICWR
jgi:hypothetical protein